MIMCQSLDMHVHAVSRCVQMVHNVNVFTYLTSNEVAWFEIVASCASLASKLEETYPLCVTEVARILHKKFGHTASVEDCTERLCACEVELLNIMSTSLYEKGVLDTLYDQFTEDDMAKYGNCCKMTMKEICDNRSFLANLWIAQIIGLTVYESDASKCDGCAWFQIRDACCELSCPTGCFWNPYMEKIQDGRLLARECFQFVSQMSDTKKAKSSVLTLARKFMRMRKRAKKESVAESVVDIL